MIDPTKVVRAALQNAASVSCLVLTETLIAEKPKKEAGDGGGHESHGND